MLRMLKSSFLFVETISASVRTSISTTSNHQELMVDPLLASSLALGHFAKCPLKDLVCFSLLLGVRFPGVEFTILRWIRSEKRSCPSASPPKATCIFWQRTQAVSFSCGGSVGLSWLSSQADAAFGVVSFASESLESVRCFLLVDSCGSMVGVSMISGSAVACEVGAVLIDK